MDLVSPFSNAENSWSNVEVFDYQDLIKLNFEQGRSNSLGVSFYFIPISDIIEGHDEYNQDLVGRVFVVLDWP